MISHNICNDFPQNRVFPFQPDKSFILQSVILEKDNGTIANDEWGIKHRFFDRFFAWFFVQMSCKLMLNNKKFKLINKWKAW